MKFIETDGRCIFSQFVDDRSIFHYTAPRPIEEAISSAGGVAFEALDEHLMLKTMPGVFCAGEMIDWETPTGGYLLTACFASGRVAGSAAAKWVVSRKDLPK